MADGEALNIKAAAIPEAPSPHMNSVLEYQRQSAARILDQLACALRGAVRRGRVPEAARYVHEHYWKDLAAGVEDVVHRRPGLSIAAALMAGYVAGRLLRSR